MTKPTKQLLVTDTGFYSDPIVNALKSRFGSKPEVLSSAEALALEPQKLKEYAAIIQAFPNRVPAIFPESSLAGADAATELLKQLRLKAGATPPVFCVALGSIEEMAQKLNGQNITFVDKRATQPAEIAELLQAAIKRSIGK